MATGEVLGAELEFLFDCEGGGGGACGGGAGGGEVEGVLAEGDVWGVGEGRWRKWVGRGWRGRWRGMERGLCSWGGPVWGMQAGGLARASYIQPREGRGNGRYEGGERGSRLTSCGAMEGRKFPRYTGGLT